jgi:hypothetical protein
MGLIVGFLLAGRDGKWRISSEGDRAGEIYRRGGWRETKEGEDLGDACLRPSDGHVDGSDRVQVAVPGHEPTRQPFRCVQIRALTFDGTWR